MGYLVQAESRSICSCSGRIAVRDSDVAGLTDTNSYSNHGTVGVVIEMSTIYLASADMGSAWTMGPFALFDYRENTAAHHSTVQG